MQYKHGIYTVTQVFPGIWRIENSHVFMDLIVGSHHALLWDTGYGYDALNEIVRRITPLPFYVVNSHGHLDHACGNWQFPEVYIHSADMELCWLHNSPQIRSEELAAAEVPEDFDPEAHLHRGCSPMVSVTEGDLFDLGGRVLEVIHLPGHTAGSIGLILREEGLIWVGDAANDFVWLFLPEAQPLSVYRNTLRKLQALDFEWMLQSHFPKPLPKDRLHWYSDLAEDLRYPEGQIVPPPLETGKEARICIRGGLTLEDRGREDFAAILIGEDKLD